MSSDDSSNDDNTEEIGDLENDSDVREFYAPRVPRKQKFVNIDETTALDNFDSLPSQGQNVFQYSYAKGTFVMNWYTDKNVQLEEPLLVMLLLFNLIQEVMLKMFQIRQKVFIYS